MIRVILLFLVLSVLVYLAILAVQKITGKQAINLTKIAIQAIISSTVAILLMFMLVILF
jgi:hypothetical protein